MLAACKVDKIDQKKECRVVKLRFNHTASIHLFSKNKYISDLDSAHIAESNDKRIVEVAEAAKATTRAIKSFSFLWIFMHGCLLYSAV